MVRQGILAIGFIKKT